MDEPANQHLLQLDQVTRWRGNRPAVEALSLALERGQVLGLLGVNGAGKSTTLAMIAGALTPHAGRVLLDGVDIAEQPKRVRDLVGWLPERAPLYAELTVGEQLAASAQLHGLGGRKRRSAVAAAIEQLDLGELAKRLCAQLSQGQRQRVGLACALLHAPPLLVLDEPCNGLDPVQVKAWRTLIAGLGKERAVIVSTHALDEVAASCSRVAILHQGTLRHEAAVDAADRAALDSAFFAIAGSGQRAA